MGWFRVILPRLRKIFVVLPATPTRLVRLGREAVVRTGLRDPSLERRNAPWSCKDGVWGKGDAASVLKHQCRMSNCVA
jgi:hypothetical protein